MSSQNHRLWLRVAMDNATQTKNYTLNQIIKAGNLQGDIAKILQQIVNDSDDNSWYIPLSGVLPSYAFDGSYEKMTPNWGMEGRMMAGAVGGIAQTLGGFAQNIPAIGHGVSKLLQRSGDFIKTFAGDIDAPRIWMRSEFKTVTLGTTVSFDNPAEFVYYRMAELWFMLMTLPQENNSKLASVTETIKKIGRFINMDEGQLKAFNLTAFVRPISDISQIDIVVGESLPFSEIGSALTLSSLVDNKPLLLFALDNVYLSSFSAQVGGEKAMTIDARGVPRIMSLSFSFDCTLLTSATNGFKRLLKTNSNRYLNVPYGISSQDIPEVTKGMSTRLDKNIRLALTKNQARISTPSRISPTYQAYLYPPVAIAEALVYNIMNLNLTVSSIEYMAGRVLRTVGPVRSIQAASGKKQYIAAGIPGLIFNTGRKLANTIPTGGV